MGWSICLGFGGDLGRSGDRKGGEAGGLHMFTTGSGEAKTEEMVRRRVERRVVGCMVLRGSLDGGVGGGGSGR